MIGIGRALEIFQVTTDTSGAGQVVVVVDVAIRTLSRWNRVHPRERETCNVVVERGV